MKKLTAHMLRIVNNRQNVQVFFIVLSLALLVLGAGAPEDGGIGGGLKR
jgi:hypothetical protein